MRKHYIGQFQYNDWANNQIIGSLSNIPSVPEKCLLLLGHVIAAQDAWYERIKGGHDWKIELWDTYSLQECGVLSDQSTQRWLNYLRNTKEKSFDRFVTYKNTKGNKYETPLSEILNHVVNHSTYHRGQINQLLKENNIPTASTDLIFYARI